MRAGRTVACTTLGAVVVIAAVLAVLVMPSAGGASNRGADRGKVLGPGLVTVQLDVRHSRSSPRVVRVRPHTEVRFVVVNHDPIGHELIVGSSEVHERHEHGTEPVHDPRPGEVSVAANAWSETTFGFHEPGTVRYACHLPGHLAYGMQGRVVVVDS